MANNISKNRLNKLKRSRNQQKYRRSVRLNQFGSGDSVSLLYVKNREDREEYELILVADNLQDLLLLAKDVPQNMMEFYFKDVVLDYMYTQVTLLNRNIDRNTLRNLPYELIINVKGDQISSNDESILYYLCDDFSGLVTSIYNNRDDLIRAFPKVNIKSIKSIKKNTFDWNHPLFTTNT
jgi:hypothetical protein